MNKTKCKTCKKWHPRLVNIQSNKSYDYFQGCKCNEKIIRNVLKHEVPVIKVVKGIVKITQENFDMLSFIMKEDET